MPVRGQKDGQPGYAHQINGEWQFIPDDPEYAPGVGPRPRTSILPEWFRGGMEAMTIDLGELYSNVPTRLQAWQEDQESVMEVPPATAEIREVERLMRPLREQYPLATAMRGLASPEVLVPSSKAAQTAAGVSVGALEMPESPVLGGLLYGGASLAFGAGGERLARAIRAKADDALGVLARRNIPTTRHQRTGDTLDQAVEAGASSIPVISSWMSRPGNIQQEAVDRGAAAVFNMTDKLTRRNLNTAKFQVQKKFQQVQNNIEPQVMDEGLMDAIGDRINPKDLEMYQQTGRLDGEALMRTRSILNEDMSNLYLDGATRPEARILNMHLDEIDKVIQGALPPSQYRLWGEARQQWQFLTALRRGKAVSGTGEVNLASMMSALDKIYPNFRFGDELPEAARGFGELVQALDELPRALQSSGTTEREGARQAMTNPTNLPFAPMALVPTARQVGQPGVDVGALLGRSAARFSEGPVLTALDALEAEQSREKEADEESDEVSPLQRNLADMALRAPD